MNGNPTRHDTTVSLIQTRQSDYERWSDDSSLMPAWNERTKLIASFIPENASVFEFGAGAGVLKQYLPSKCKYQKSDLVDRDGCTIVIDLNKDELKPVEGFTTAIFSGVLEYLHDLPRVAQFLSKSFETVILSYACLEKNNSDRRSHGWVNDFTISDLIGIFRAAGFVLHNYRTWKTQTILYLVKTKGNKNPSLVNIEHTFAISLESDESRKSHIAAEMSALGLQDFNFFPAINFDEEKVKLAYEHQLIQVVGVCFRCGKSSCQCFNNVLIPKQVGNWLSFLSVLHVIALGQYSVAMVCEDDVKFTYYASDVFRSMQNNKEIMDNLESSKPTLIRLGYPGYSPDIHKINGEVNFSNNKVMSNSCFVCNAAYAQFVINSINASGGITHTSDVYFHSLCISDSVKSFTAQPPPAFDLSQSRLTHSAIHPKAIDEFDIDRDRTHVKRVLSSIASANVFGGNFGDVLGSYIFEKIVGTTPKNIFINNKEVKSQNTTEHYMIVGSILKHTSELAWLWGVGIMHEGDVEQIYESIVPEQIYALRGPITKKALEAAGLQLPKQVALGDPAILLPLMRAGSHKKQYKFGVIPHFTEYGAVRERYKDHPNVVVICLGEHKTKASVDNTIDLITSCEKILSSSLHGIIVAHAYGIPAVWCNFTEVTQKQKNGTTKLKFQDYYESVNLSDVNPVSCLSKNAEFPQEGEYTLPDTVVIEMIQSDLLKYCPFNFLGLDRDELCENEMLEAKSLKITFSQLLSM